MTKSQISAIINSVSDSSKKVFKWVEIARDSTPIRYEVLSDCINKKGSANEFTSLEVAPADFDDALAEALEKYDAIRLASPYGLQVVDKLQGQRADIVHLGAGDSLVKKADGRWVLTATGLEGMKHIVRVHGKKIHLKASSLIVGSGAQARFSIVALMQIGVKHFKISNQFQEQAKELIAELKRKYFGVEFEFIPEDRLVLLPGTNSVLINSTPLVTSNSILRELYYFNFLRTDGLVIDLTFLPLTTPLVKEAQQIGIQSVRGYEVLGWADVEWAKSTFNINLDYEEYSSLLLEAGTKWEEQNSPQENSAVKKDSSGPLF